MVMKATHKCLKEWNATIEALGIGKQTILIRNYSTTLKGFLLYPTVTYSSKENYLDSFQEQFQDFVDKNALPKKKDDKILIKFFCSLEKIIEMPVSMIPSDDYYIWTEEHVKEYITGKTAFIWVLRVYYLKEPHWAEIRGGIKYTNLKDDVSLGGIHPVLSNSEFSKILGELK